MTTEQYQSISPREATPGAGSRLFSFERVRSGSATRFMPGAGAKLHFANRDVDTLEMPGVPSGYLAAGDAVKAYYKGVCVFQGDVATIAEARGRGDDATQTVTCVGPWSKMSRLVYRQNWFTGGGYSRSSRLILNQHQDGTPQNLDSELYEIASHGAAACGYTVALADVSVSTQQLPFDECRDITVADAIRRELRFFPKAICRFDYSGATPALEIKKNTSAATAAYVAAIPKNRRECVYNAHPITGVDLEIEATGTIDGVEYRTIAHQTAGDTTADNPDCLYATLQIKGASASAVRQSFKSVTEDIPSNLNDVSWWKARHPRLANVAASAVTITDGARSPSNYPRISAATAGELEEAGLHCEVSKFTCKATIETTDDKEEEVHLTMNFLTTNAKTKTYTWVAESSAESGESVPSGLASTILAERSGSLLSERLSIRLGDALPQLGDAIVESEGTVFLQSFDVDCAALTADLQFGVPDYLSPEDMASLLSSFRNKCTSSSSTVRKTGKAEDKGSDVKMGAIPPLSSTEFAPGTKSKTTIKGSGQGGKIRLDATELADGEQISAKKLTGGDQAVCGILATGDVAVIGGGGIHVETHGQTIKITADSEKTESDDDPNNPDKDPCAPHPGSEGGGGGESSGGDGGGGVKMDNADSEDAGGGCAGCGEGSTSGGSSATGQPEPGASGKPASGGEAKPNGEQNPSAPSAGPASSSAEGSAQGSGGTAGGKPASPGMFNGSTLPVSGRLGQGATTPLYGGTHSQLSSSNTMNTSPFAQSGNYKPIGSGATTPIYSGGKTPLYGGTHSQLADGKTLNESPFKSRR